MLSSIILSMAMSLTPTNDINTQNIEMNLVGDARGTIRINNIDALETTKAGDARGTIRINNTNALEITKTGDARGTIRI